MELILIFGALTLFFFALFIIYLDLLVFYFRQKKRFLKAGGEKEYLEDLENHRKKLKNPQKKNFLLYLICLACVKQGYDKKAKRLSAFIKTDLLLGIYPKKMNF